MFGELESMSCCHQSMCVAATFKEQVSSRRYGRGGWVCGYISLGVGGLGSGNESISLKDVCCVFNRDLAHKKSQLLRTEEVFYRGQEPRI